MGRFKEIEASIIGFTVSTTFSISMISMCDILMVNKWPIPIQV
jgi:hypothetical protein